MSDEILSFIQADLARERRLDRRVLGIYVLVSIAVPAAIGLALRRDFGVGGYDTLSLVANGFAAVLLGLFPAFYALRNRGRGRAARVAGGAILLAVLFSANRVFLETSGTLDLSTGPGLLRDASHCFEKGAMAAIAMGIWLVVFSTYFTSRAPLRWRVLVASSAGATASVMLGFHCDSASVFHVLVGHLAPGILVGTAVFFASTLLARRSRARAIPSLGRTLAHPERIDR